jgi:hypothetical protein
MQNSGTNLEELSGYGLPDVLLQQKLDQHEVVTLQEARRLPVQRLRELVRDSDPAITAQRHAMLGGV